MKLFKLKRKNIILVSLLAIAGFLGISSVAVNTATSKEVPVAEKAEAATNHNIVYYRGRLNAPLIHFWGGSGGSKWGEEPQMNLINSGYSAEDTNAIWWYDIGNNSSFLIRNPTRSWQSSDYGFNSSKPVFNNNNNQLEALPDYIQTIPSSTRIYVFADTAVSSDSATFKIKFDTNAPCTADDNFDMTNISGTDYWYFDIGASAKFFMIQRYSTDGSTWWNETKVFTYSQIYTRPTLKWSNLAGGETRGYLPEDIKVKGEYNSWTDESFAFDSSKNLYYKDITTSANNQQIYIHAIWNKGESTDTAIGYSDGISSVATYVSGSSNIKILSAGKYRIYIGPNVWLYTDKQNIWATNDGSRIIKLYDVTFTAGSGGTVSSSSILSVPDGSSISVSGNKVTIDGRSVTATASDPSAQYTYSFSSWSNTGGTINANRTITANFTSTLNTYTVTFVTDGSGYGSVNKSTIANVPYGATVSVSSNTVTINGTTVTATAASDSSGYHYAFSSWSNAPATITGAVTITANFSATSGEAAAITYAKAFNTSISKVCVYAGGTPKSDLADAWNDQDDAYDVLGGYVQYWLDKSHASTDSNVLAMFAKYDYVYGKYGEEIGEDFLNRNPAPVLGLHSSPFDLFGSEDNFSTIIIIISGSVALLSVTALSILVIRKRKSKED